LHYLARAVERNPGLTIALDEFPYLVDAQSCRVLLRVSAGMSGGIRLPRALMSSWGKLSRKSVANMPGDFLEKILLRQLRRSEESGTPISTSMLPGSF
jgi:hypothetical protein